MIDTHTHILPCIDDGASSIEESFEMIKEAENAGFTDLICTSHFIPDSYETGTKEREKIINAMQKIIDEKDISITLHNGGEAYICENLEEYIKDKTIPLMAKSNYILFELPINTEVIYIKEVVNKLIEMKLIPILAHPERYTYFQKRTNILMELFDMGVPFQVNFGSVLGMYGVQEKILAEKLLKNDMVKFLGTDSHRKRKMYIKINEALRKIEQIVGKEKIKELTQTNPRLLL